MSNEPKQQTLGNIKNIKWCSECHIAPASYYLKPTDEYLFKQCYKDEFGQKGW